MEICEVQLMSLANKIHNTEINHEIDKYLASINQLFEDSTKEDLIKKFFSVEFTRFFNYYQRSKDLNVSADNSSSRDNVHDDNSSRYFINVGRKDGYDWMSLKDFLKEVLELGKDDVFKVDVKESFSFFNTEKGIQEKVLAFFTDFKHNGRFVNVEVSTDRGGGGRNRGGGRRNDRRSGGGGRRDGRRSGERRSKPRNDSGSRSDRRSSERRSDSRNSSSNRSDRRSSDNSSRSRRSDSGSKSNDSGFSRPRRSRR